ncbi:hypothetical protein [uncultured Nocardioides sp.]|uniref:hypothetical protein n=1 Tax=uncultured Nocardioides sp. TaxID=198441 RepID=UPI0025DD039B|nr:hypothetical protein [uncultured Nocardioides sp.]
MCRAALPSDVPVGRRALVLTFPGLALALTSCDLDPRAGRAEPDAPAPPEDPDLDALGAVVDATDAAAALVAATISAHPALGPRLAAFGELHTAHRGALDGAADRPQDTATTTPPSVPPVRAQALAALRRSESALATALAGGALRADSGAFARLLAVMSAAVQQELLALDRRVAP